MKGILNLFSNMISWILVGIAVLFALIWLARPKVTEPSETCEHQWSAATCTERKHCTVCDGESGAALGHNWVDASFTSPKTCARCGLTEGKSEVNWSIFLGDSFTDEFTYAEADNGEPELTFVGVTDARLFMEELRTVCTKVGAYWPDEDVGFTIIVEDEQGLLHYVLLCRSAPDAPQGVDTDSHDALGTALGKDLQALYNKMFDGLRM